jgi:3-phosphoshikimate 1-carboxyvinyltransferase
MGAIVQDIDGRAPLHFQPTHLKGMTYSMPVASAQVKSCLLLAGLFAEGETTIIEPGPARDHTERMLSAMGADLKTHHHTVTITGKNSLHPLDLTIAGDPSSAAFLLVAGTLLPNTQFTLEGIGVNDTRTGILDVLGAMGAVIHQSNLRDEGGEPVADLTIQTSSLCGTSVAGDVVVRMIDEFPILMVAATQATGATMAADAEELRVKETDRIAVMATELRKLGATIEERPDGFYVVGPQSLKGGVVNGHDDHRIAMSLVIAGLFADGETLVEEARCVEDSFPTFVQVLQDLGADVQWEQET